MDLNELVLRGIDLAKSEPVIAVIVMLVVAALFYFKTKAMLKLLAFVLICAALFYFLTLLHGMTSSGISQKEKGIERSLQ